MGTKSLTVALDVTPLAGPRTGIGHFVAELFPALRARPDTVVLPYVLSRRAPRVVDGAGAVRRLALPAALATRWWGRFGAPAFDRPLRPASVVHGTNFVAPPGRIPTVITVHDCAFARLPDLCTPDTLAYGRAVARTIKRGGWVHTPSEYVASEVRELFGTTRVRAVHHGVPALPADIVPPTTTGGAPFVLFLGTLEPRKRPELLVEAFSTVAADDPDVHLVLAGSDGPARPHVEAAEDRLAPDVRRRVHRLGYVTEPERAALLRAARAFVYPSRYEGFGLPVVEAMAAGTPVVATAVGAIPEVAGDGALLTAPECDALAEALITVLRDDEVRARLVAAGTRNIERFSWKRCAEGLASLYREAGA